MGEAPDSFVLVESAEGVDRLPFGPDDKLAYLTQTTLSVDDANRIIERLKQRFRRLSGRPRKTSATQHRTAKRRCGTSAVRQISCWCSVARTAATASGWPSLHVRMAFRRI